MMNAIDARFAALRAQESGHYETAGVAGPGSESVKVREDTVAPALSDADVLERAAEIERRRGLPSLADLLARDAAELRAASAPVPVPKPVDVFEAFGAGTDRRMALGLRATIRARDWFGPLVEFAESVESSEELYPSLGAEARAALSALRQRAQEASR